MEAPIQQTQVEEGQAETTSAPQATETIDQPQTSTPSQVEGGQSTSQAQPGTPDYETARQIKNLVKEFRSFKQSFNPRSSEPPQAAPKPSVPQVTREELVQDPINAIKKILDGGKSEVRDDILKAIEEKESLRQKENLRQEGLRLIRTNELIRKDPNGEERMKEILLEEDDDGNSLEAYAQVNPKHAAQLALKEYQSRYGQGKNAFAPSKAQMASMLPILSWMTCVRRVGASCERCSLGERHNRLHIALRMPK